jgi:hypothetical protein
VVEVIVLYSERAWTVPQIRACLIVANEGGEQSISPADKEDLLMYVGDSNASKEWLPDLTVLYLAKDMTLCDLDVHFQRLQLRQRQHKAVFISLLLVDLEHAPLRLTCRCSMSLCLHLCWLWDWAGYLYSSDLLHCLLRILLTLFLVFCQPRSRLAHHSRYSLPCLC